MKLYFIGADHEVTGSCHLLEVNGKHLMLDCGMEQGRDVFENAPLPVPASQIDAVILSHAHIDHSGMLPKLVHDGFAGKIWTTKATADLSDVMLRDSAHIQESDAEWKSRKAKRAGQPEVLPAYTVQDVENTVKLFEPVSYDEEFEPVEGVKAHFEDAGHILGSAISYLNIHEGNADRTLCFTGDLGNIDMPILQDPADRKKTDYVMMESTYGDRCHEAQVDHVQQLADLMNETFAKGGNLIIPCFAVGRTQEMLYFIREILENNLVKYRNFTVYVDSPLAVEATRIFTDNTFGYYDAEAMKVIKEGNDPLSLPNLKLSVSAEDSKAINDDTTPCVILSASGMCDAGRIRHHLKHNLWKNNCTVALAGYQAEGTLGRRLQDGASDVTILGEKIHVAARIVRLQDVSAHADQKGLIRWLDSCEDKPKKLFLVHGEDSVCSSFRDMLKADHGYRVDAPYSGSVYDLINDVWILEKEPVEVIRKKSEQQSAQSSANYERDNLYLQLVEEGKRLAQLITTYRKAGKDELKHFLKDVQKLIERWDSRS